jgi:mannosyl-3-phosphoglycerate phosphatase
MTQPIVFSDLDGTLLNHDDYKFHDAKPSLALLQNNSVPLILSTSKTFTEVVKIHENMQLKYPFIVENGGGIYVPKECILASRIQSKESWTKISHAKSYIELRSFFTKMQKRYKIRGFGDMTHKEVMEFTSLDHESAMDAMQRDFTEPFLIKDESKIPFLRQEALTEGFDIVKGGRFYHLVSKDQDKSHAMLKLRNLYAQHLDAVPTTIALGDSQNDFKMLQTADIGVLMPNKHGKYPSLQSQNKLLRAAHPGPKGWNKAVKEIFDGR